MSVVVRNGVCHRSDAILKEAFRHLRHVVSHAVDADQVLVLLADKHIIADSDMTSLRQGDDRVERCNRLLSVLLESADDDTFIELRLALTRVPAYTWLVDEIDKKHQELMTSLAAVNQMKLVESG